MSNYEGRFWSWFERVVLPGLARLEVPEAAVIDEIDQRIRGLGLSWELGPAPDGIKSWAFAVSFSADLSLLPSAQALADAAPSMAGCQVLVGKPPKQWNGILNLPTPDGVASFCDRRNQPQQAPDEAVMRYFKLLDDVQIPRRWHLGDVVTSTGFTPRLRVGLRCDDDDLAAEPGTQGLPLEYSLTSFAVPIVSEHLSAEICGIAGEDVQRLPVNIPEVYGYDVLNILRVVDCLDEARSEYIKWKEEDHRADLAGQYRSVTRLRVDHERIPEDAHIFRIERWPIGIVVSEGMKAAMEEVGCFGARFLEVS